MITLYSLRSESCELQWLFTHQRVLCWAPLGLCCSWAFALFLLPVCLSCVRMKPCFTLKQTTFVKSCETPFTNVLEVVIMKQLVMSTCFTCTKRNWWMHLYPSAISIQVRWVGGFAFFKTPCSQFARPPMSPVFSHLTLFLSRMRVLLTECVSSSHSPSLRMRRCVDDTSTPNLLTKSEKVRKN